MKCYLKWCIWTIIVTPICGSSSLMSRFRNQPTSTTVLDSGANSWNAPVPHMLQDVLVSIDDKLRSFDTFGYTVKLARLDLSLEQLVRRLENIEAKLSRMETKFDVRMQKVEEIVVSKDLKEEFSNEHMVRRMDNLNDKINTRTSFLDAKMDVGNSRIGSKLDLLEREFNGRMGDIFEKLSTDDEKRTMFENQVLDNFKTLDVANQQMSESQKEFAIKLDQFLVKRDQPVTDSNNVMNAINHVTNHTVNIQSSLEELREVCQSSDNVKVSDNRLRSILSNYEVTSNQTQKQTKDKMDNLTSIIHKALKLNEAKFKELDSDVEQYTKKVISGMENLWKSSDEVKSYLYDAVEQGNKTREIIRNEFSKLYQQITPLPMIEPKLADVSRSLNKKLSELSATVDHSFATLLIAQNTFISTCHRIQENEVNIYSILEQVVHEMRNRSELDMHTITANLITHSNDMSRNLDSALMTILATNNETASRILEILLSKDNVQLHKNCDLTEIEAISLNAKKGDETVEKVHEDDMTNTGATNHTGTVMDYDTDYQMQESDYPET